MDTEELGSMARQGLVVVADVAKQSVIVVAVQGMALHTGDNP
jgi:hypothetical protein